MLEETRARERRLRVLPSRVGIYFVLSLGLFPGLGYGGVWKKLVAGLGGLPVPSPSARALRDLRRRLGAAPLKVLFEVLAGPVAQPSTPGVATRAEFLPRGDCPVLKGLRGAVQQGCPELTCGVRGIPWLHWSAQRRAKGRLGEQHARHLV